MKKQFLMTMAILTLIWTGCQKDRPQQEISKDLKWEIRELRDDSGFPMINPPPVGTTKLQASPGGTVTLQNVTVVGYYPPIGIKFGWENDGTFQNHPVVTNVVSSINGSGSTWSQGLVYTAYDPNNPNNVNMIVTGTYTYLSSSITGAYSVKQVVQIKIVYNTITGGTSTVVSTTSSAFTR